MAEPRDLSARLVRAASSVGAVSVLARLAGLGRDIAIAATFGLSDSLDAWLIALIPVALASGILAATVTAAVVPEYVRLRGRDPGGADTLAGAALGWTALLTLGTGLVVLALAGPLAQVLAPGFDDAKRALTGDLIAILALVLVPQGLSAILAGLGHAHDRFAALVATQILTPAVLIVLLVGWGAQGALWPLWAGTWAGALAELTLVALLARRAGVRLRPGLSAGAALGSVRAAAIPMLIGSTVMHATVFVDQMMATLLEGGAVSALAVGNRLVSGLATLGALSLGTAALPLFSAEADPARLRAGFLRVTGLALALTVPMALALVVFAGPLVDLVFRRGAFDAADADLTAAVMVAYAFQLPFYIAGTLSGRLLIAQGRTQAMMLIAMAGFLANVAGNLVLMQIWGAVGIAASTSIVYALTFTLGAVVCLRGLR